MSVIIATTEKRAVVYPETDGEPMAENTLQYEWIVTFKEGIEAVFANRPDVFVAADLFWYPVEGDNKTRTAPDVLVALGRPKGPRRSYMQWEEGGIAPQVVIEVLSPGNRSAEMIRKFNFYRKYGVEEYYIYDPDDDELTGWLREGDELTEIARMDGWKSPRLGITFDRSTHPLRVFGPDGRKFLTFQEQREARERAEHRADQAEHRADQAEHRADRAERLAEQLTQRLRALGFDPFASGESDPG